MSDSPSGHRFGAPSGEPSGERSGDAVPPPGVMPGPHEAWAQAIRAAAAGEVAVTPAETDAAWHRLSARVSALPDAPAAPVRALVSPVVRRPRWRGLAAAAALVGVAVLSRGVLPAGLNEAIAPAGQRVTVQLADGSSMTLAAGSRARWPRRFGGEAREVQLTGEAYFEVAHDTRHPFRVRVKRGVVEDIGTRFLVESWSDTAAFTVVVTDGVVAVADSATHADRAVASLTRVEAGQRAALLANGHVQVSPADSGALAWLSGSLVFTNTPLLDALPTIARWYGVRIDADSSLLGRRLTGRFVQQPLPQLLDALGLALNVRVEQQTYGIRLLP